MKSIAKITVANIELEVHFDFHKGIAATFYDQEEDSELIINSIWLDCVDIIELLSELVLMNIELQLEESMTNDDTI